MENPDEDDKTGSFLSHKRTGDQEEDGDRNKDTKRDRDDQPLEDYH